MESYEARVHSAFGGEKPDARDPRTLAWLIRRNGLEMTHLSRGSHIGSVFSAAEITAVLYASVLHVDPADPKMPDRDRMILSKGHAGSAVYSALAETGFFPVEELKEHYANGSRLSGHVSHKGVPGVEVSTGALGHGLAVGAGLALGAKMDGASWRTYVVLGDGECDEGAVWEAFMAASHFGLSNLTAIIDKNGFQLGGRTQDVLQMDNIAERIAAFGWETRECDGHDPQALYNALYRDPQALCRGSAGIAEVQDSRPLAVIANTVKGKGFSFSEGNNAWHHAILSDSQYEAALEELEIL